MVDPQTSRTTIKGLRNGRADIRKNLETGRKSLANPPPEVRAETRIPKRILVRLWNLENDGFEITPTVDISSHGAQVVSRLVWQPNEQLLVQSIRGFGGPATANRSFVGVGCLAGGICPHLVHRETAR